MNKIYKAIQCLAIYVEWGAAIVYEWARRKRMTSTYMTRDCDCHCEELCYEDPPYCHKDRQ